MGDVLSQAIHQMLSAGDAEIDARFSVLTLPWSVDSAGSGVLARRQEDRTRVREHDGSPLLPSDVLRAQRRRLPVIGHAHGHDQLPHLQAGAERRAEDGRRTPVQVSHHTRPSTSRMSDRALPNA